MDYYSLSLQYADESHHKQGWSTHAQQEIRFLVFLEYLEKMSRSPEPWTLLDFGCGLGEWFDFSQKHQFTHYLYHGMDAHTGMIQKAKHRLPNHHFQHGSWQDIQENYDIILASGVFNVKEYWKIGEVDACIKKLYHHSKKALLLNLLHPQDKNSSLQGFDPEEMLHSIREFCPQVQIKKDYFPNDFTLFLPHETHTTPERTKA